MSTGTEDDLPKSIIVTNVEQSVFDNPQLKVTVGIECNLIELY